MYKETQIAFLFRKIYINSYQCRIKLLDKFKKYQITFLKIYRHLQIIFLKDALVV